MSNRVITSFPRSSLHTIRCTDNNQFLNPLTRLIFSNTFSEVSKLHTKYLGGKTPYMYLQHMQYLFMLDERLLMRVCEVACSSMVLLSDWSSQTHLLNGHRSHCPLQLQGPAVRIETNHLGHPGGKPLPHLRDNRRLVTSWWGGRVSGANFFLIKPALKTTKATEYLQCLYLVSESKILHWWSVISISFFFFL